MPAFSLGGRSGRDGPTHAVWRQQRASDGDGDGALLTETEMW